jgi:hypothetical protein
MSLAHEKFAEWQKRRNAAPVHVDLQSTALVIIDMQECTAHARGAAGGTATLAQHGRGKGRRFQEGHHVSIYWQGGINGRNVRAEAQHAPLRS